MKNLNVVTAIIHKDEKILATKCSYDEFVNQWEFPGGEIEANETKEEALIREIKEKLNIDIEITNFALDVEYSYPTFNLKMDCFDCKIKNGTPELLEHKWLSKHDLDSVDWIPADVDVVNYLKETMFDAEIMEIMKRTDEKMQACNYDLDKLKELYENSENDLEKELIFAEIRSIEISNTIK